MTSVNRLFKKDKKVLSKKNIANKTIVLYIAIIFVMSAFIPAVGSVSISNPSPPDG